jgi:TonB family protein
MLKKLWVEVYMRSILIYFVLALASLVLPATVTADEDWTECDPSAFFESLDSKDVAKPTLEYGHFEYPNEAKGKCKYAETVVRIWVTRKGTVDSVESACTTCPGLGFEEAAIAGVRDMRFETSFRRRSVGKWLFFLVPIHDLMAPPITEDSSVPSSTEYTPVDEIASMTHKDVADYPIEAVNAGMQGEVWVKVLVNPEGRVADALIYRSSGHYILDKSALKSAWKYRYKPAIQNGKPVAMWVAYKVDFWTSH